MGALDQNFLEFPEQPVKLKIQYLLTVVKQNVKTKWENKDNQIFLNKIDPTTPRSFY